MPQADTDPMVAEALKRAVNRSQRRVMRAISVAGLSGWTMGIFGAISLLTGWGSLSAILIGALLVLCSFQELRGRKMLKNLDGAAPRLLSRNQILIALGIAGYCLYCALQPDSTSSELRAAFSEAGMSETVDQMSGLLSTVMKAAYYLIIVITLPFQALVAWFYLSREADIARLRSIGRLHAEPDSWQTGPVAG